mmetsp:Transcript_9532/g.28428  ORF Transcript_9532/g.28428 Transcript_9532/m.28428 type:complete len:298 (-) Transcript_9532:403-1296(-)
MDYHRMVQQHRHGGRPRKGVHTWSGAARSLQYAVLLRSGSGVPGLRFRDRLLPDGHVRLHCLVPCLQPLRKGSGPDADGRPSRGPEKPDAAQRAQDCGWVPPGLLRLPGAGDSRNHCHFRVVGLRGGHFLERTPRSQPPGDAFGHDHLPEHQQLLFHVPLGLFHCRNRPRREPAGGGEPLWSFHCRERQRPVDRRFQRGSGVAPLYNAPHLPAEPLCVGGRTQGHCRTDGRDHSVSGGVRLCRWRPNGTQRNHKGLWQAKSHGSDCALCLLDGRRSAGLLLRIAPEQRKRRPLPTPR